MKTKILVVEDDPHISLGLEEILKGEDFEVTICTRGDKAVEAVSRSHPTLVILDVMLPGANGFEICKQLRAKKVGVPILMLTAKGQEIDKVIGLDSGADDYVTKPFSPRELVLRVKALLKRSQGERTSSD
ncbi:MAG TPA: response regulator transcription factor, partial [Candidatus Binatia bacterium]|nr:response regulator transcription factor [Candidatus Binatia bacterium]